MTRVSLLAPGSATHGTEMGQVRHIRQRMFILNEIGRTDVVGVSVYLECKKKIDDAVNIDI